MTEDPGFPPEYEDLADAVRAFAHNEARPRLTAEQVRQQGTRRRRTRRNAIGGIGAVALAGIVAGAVLASHPGGPATVVNPPAGHPTATCFPTPIPKSVPHPARTCG